MKFKVSLIYEKMYKRNIIQESYLEEEFIMQCTVLFD